MNETKMQLTSEEVTIRNYRLVDETRLVKFLNLCYGEWGNLQKWHALYYRHPTFNTDDVFIMEKNGKIIGHESLHFRYLEIQRDVMLNTATLSDAATHPRYRGRGLHNKLMEIIMEAAKSKGASLVFSWYLRGTGLHAHSRKVGFVEVGQPAAYMKVMRPEKVFRSGLSDFMQKSPKLKMAVQDFGDDLYFRFGRSEFSINELLGVPSKKKAENHRRVEIFFDESSISVLAQFRTLDMRQRLQHLVLLFLLRKAKVRLGSFRALLNMFRKGVAIIGSI